MFNPETYIQRRKRLKQELKSGIALLPGNDESPMNYADNTYHYRQDSNFLYYFGLDFAGLTAVIDIDNDRDIIFGNELTIDDIVWMGRQPSLAEKSQYVGADASLPAANLPFFLKDALDKGRKVHFLPPYRPENKIKLWEWLGILPGVASPRASLDFIKAVVAQRSIKSDEEIAEIDRAACISVDMHRAAIRMARPGLTEAHIAAEVERIALSHNGHVAFPVILTINGQTLHNHFHGNTLKDGDLVLCDAGAETDSRYAADLSSSFPASPTFSPRQKEIYLLSLRVYENAINQLKPGVEFRNIHLNACRNLAQGMKELGFMKGDIDDAVNEGAHAMFFPCGLGHMMGLDVHDMEDLGEVWVGYDGKPKSTLFGLKSLRLARELKPGFVLTIEPGIYFIPELIQRWRSENKFTDFLNYDKIESYRDFGGLRNEENFLITPNGFRLLGKPKPRTPEELAAAREE